MRAKHEHDIIQHIKEEETDSYSDDSLFRISSWGADLSFRELIQRYEDDELVKPELQRHYIWDRSEASRFIDSLLLGLPVPSIFLAQTSDEKLLIIDGFQRIMTVYDFVRGIFSQDGKVFRLSRSDKINKRWRGRAFSELGEAEQRRNKRLQPLPQQKLRSEWRPVKKADQPRIEGKQQHSRGENPVNKGMPILQKGRSSNPRRKHRCSKGYNKIIVHRLLGYCQFYCVKFS